MAELFLLPKTDQPATSNLTLPDAEARAAALDIHRSWIVEAPAGSGKTGLILQRFLKLLATVDDPAQVLAITFTRKATAELRERIFTQLAAANQASEPDSGFDRQTRAFATSVLARDRALGWNLLEHPHRLNVRTIDSLAADIAAGLPILSGSGGPRQPDPFPEPLYQEAALRTFQQLGGPNPRLNHALETILLHRDGNLANCQTLIATMLAQRDQWGELIPLGSDLDDAWLDRHVLPRFEKALDLAICRGLTQLTRALPPGLLEALTRLGAGIGHSPHCTGLTPARQAADLEHWNALIELLLTKSDTVRKSGGINRSTFSVELSPAHKAELIQLLHRIRDDESLCDLLATVRALPPATYPPAQWLVAKALFHILSRALTELQLVFAARAACDFAELSLLARTALRADSALDDLRASSALDLQHLLVDEMQDTSSGQYELIQLLTQRWDGHSQTVFLVGDPKQSIYLFRQARVERFLRTLESGRLGPHPDAMPLTALHLTTNFRSQPSLVESFNHMFSPVFGARGDGELIPYHPVTAVRQPTSATGTTWHATIVPYLADTEACAAQRRLQRRIHAAKLRDLVAEFRARPHPQPPTIAVLVRNRIHLHEIVSAFRAAAIPYRAVEIEPLAERPEILDLIALTRALLHPADRTAWLALLRSPWCGLTLADIHLLTGQDDDAFQASTVLELLETRGDLLSADAIARLQPFWTTLSAALPLRPRMPLAEWVHHTWRAFRTHLYLAPESLTGVDRFLALLDELEDAGTLSLPRLQQRLTRLYATPSVHPGAVDLMTIHGAKGLEWDLVLVPGLERAGMNTNGRLLDWLETDPSDSSNDIAGDDIAPGIVAPIRGKGGAVGKLNEWMRSLERNREAAERKRLFYVACTRARDRLHLFATLEQNGKGEVRPIAGSLLSAAWPAAAEHFATQQPTPIRTLKPAATLEDEPLALAASAAEPTRLLHRLPTPPFQLTPPESRGISQPGVPHHHRGAAEVIVGAVTSRSQANFPARALGNTTHAFLEQLTHHLATGHAAETLLTRLPTWTPRIATLLRSAGLSPEEVQRRTPTVLRALTQALTDPTGLWILSPHPQSATESPIISWTGTETDERSAIRVDRTFLAGPDPLTVGETHLWIVDYKTATHGPEDLEAFLAAQQQHYRPQLERYAAQLATPARATRLGLYYPLLQRLLWW